MSSRLKWSVVGMMAMVSLAGSAKPASAVEIVGLYNFTLGAVTVTLGEVDWNPPLNPGLDATPTYGSFDINPFATRTGVFAGAEFSALGLGAAGSAPVAPEMIQDLSSNPLDANYVPVGANAGVTNFFMLAEQPTWQFTQNFLAPGTAGSPFLLVEDAGNVNATVTVRGIAWDTNTPSLITNWVAIITAQYTNESIASILAKVVAGTLPNNAWSGTFEATAPTAVPEPATLLTFGVGALIVGAVRRRRTTKA